MRTTHRAYARARAREESVGGALLLRIVATLLARHGGDYEALKDSLAQRRTSAPR